MAAFGDADARADDERMQPERRRAERRSHELLELRVGAEFGARPQILEVRVRPARREVAVVDAVPSTVDEPLTAVERSARHRRIADAHARRTRIPTHTAE